FTAMIIAAGTCLYHYILVRVGGNVAWLDAATVAIGLAATTLEMLRYREQYIWWLITDFVAVAMYIVRFDPVYLTKKSIYLIMAVIGLINWIKLSRLNGSNE
ncbi:MAG: nicotinamide mononucleotide transporter, partial [Firmicutes bacterium]|nr:nicotinamide mononucleotide transporter [Bacillota bacterium]